MGTTRLFFPQSTLDAWLGVGAAQLAGGRLTVQPEQHQFRVLEAVRIVDEVSGAEDAYQLAGKVKPLAHVQELGAEILGDSMVLGNNAYDVVLGWVILSGAASDAPLQHRLDNAARRHQSEAEVLAQFLARNL
jgi:hypothetical protein